MASDSLNFFLESPANFFYQISVVLHIAFKDVLVNITKTFGFKLLQYYFLYFQAQDLIFCDNFLVQISFFEANL